MKFTVLLNIFCVFLYFNINIFLTKCNNIGNILSSTALYTWVVRKHFFLVSCYYYTVKKLKTHQSFYDITIKELTNQTFFYITATNYGCNVATYLTMKVLYSDRLTSVDAPLPTPRQKKVTKKVYLA